MRVLFDLLKTQGSLQHWFACSSATSGLVTYRYAVMNLCSGWEVNWDVERRDNVTPVSSIIETAWSMENTLDRKHKSEGRAGCFKYLGWED